MVIKMYYTERLKWVRDCKNITQKEKETASNLAQANAINLYSQVKELTFAQAAQEFAGKV